MARSTQRPRRRDHRQHDCGRGPRGLPNCRAAAVGRTILGLWFGVIAGVAVAADGPVIGPVVVHPGVIAVAKTSAGPVGPTQPEPQVIAQQLLRTYGQRLESLAYIPAMAVRARLRFAELTQSSDDRALVGKLLAEPRPAPKNQSELAGHLLLTAWASQCSGEEQRSLIDAIRRAADPWLAAPAGKLVKPPTSTEMSDAVFMVPPLLAEAGRLTGDRKYLDAAIEYQQGMVALRQRADGLFQHGHLCDAAWGRGNGFPAVGMTLLLSAMPDDHPQRAVVLADYHRHLAALVKHQASDGRWRQVIDHPEAYLEFTATAMIGFAIERGIQRGWLEATVYRPIVDRAWSGLCAQIQPQGTLLDVCESTGTQKSLADYLARKAIRGRDYRGGAMALLFAVERMEIAARSTTKSPGNSP